MASSNGNLTGLGNGGDVEEMGRRCWWKAAVLEVEVLLQTTWQRWRKGGTDDGMVMRAELGDLRAEAFRVGGRGKGESWRARS